MAGSVDYFAVATLLVGIALGLLFGLTGSGGSTFAVPLLVYVLGMDAHRAICVSMIAIGAMAAVHLLQNLHHKEIDAPKAIALALPGFFAAPFGAWVGSRVDEAALLLVFSGVVLIAAFRLWKTTTSVELQVQQLASNIEPGKRVAGKGAATVLVGVAAGFSAGLLGIGGGFIIVPAMVVLHQMPIRRTIPTSMLCIFLLSLAAMAGHWFAGQRPPLGTVAIFLLGAIVGLAPGMCLGRHLTGARLQKNFAVVLLVAGGLMALRSLGLL
jgi:uncharacterized membrane protein YfcA